MRIPNNATVIRAKTWFTSRFEYILSSAIDFFFISHRISRNRIFFSSRFGEWIAKKKNIDKNENRDKNCQRRWQRCEKFNWKMKFPNSILISIACNLLSSPFFFSCILFSVKSLFACLRLVTDCVVFRFGAFWLDLFVCSSQIINTFQLKTTVNKKKARKRTQENMKQTKRLLPSMVLPYSFH